MSVAKINDKVFYSEEDSIKKEELSEFIKNMDNVFINPLFKRPEFVSYEYYSNRFLDNGKAVFLRSEAGSLIAISIFYADPVEYDLAYIPYTGVLPRYQGLGLGKKMLIYRNKIIKEVGMDGILSSCAADNEKMIVLLESQGFKRINDEKKIEELKRLNPKDDWDKAFFTLLF